MSAFFLTSGRSGSTAIARLLHTHPDIAVVSDLFEPAVNEPYFDARSQLTGDEFWQILTRPSIPERIAYWRRHPTDELLFLPEHDHDVSLLMSYTLPFLSADPWSLREHLEPVIRQTDAASAPHHFTRFCEHVRAWCGAKVWVERTGGSLPHTERMIAAWPNARFVFLIREPIETALSMQHGSFFRLYLAMQSGDEAHWSNERFADPVQLAAMLERWTVDAVAAMKRLAPEQLLTMTYERFVTDPEQMLLQLLSFVRPGELTSADRTWARQQANQVIAAPVRAAHLAPDRYRAVQRACASSTTAWHRALT